jgi:hypothetical protein
MQVKFSLTLSLFWVEKVKRKIKAGLNFFVKFDFFPPFFISNPRKRKKKYNKMPAG